MGLLCTTGCESKKLSFKTIQTMTEQAKQRITILSLKDLEVSYYCGSGAGGQARNKVASGVMLRHAESGAIGRASDSRSQLDNKRSAWERLIVTPQMKFWLAKKVYEVKSGEKLEAEIEREMQVKNLKFEIKDSDGRWSCVDEQYFSTPAATVEV